MNIELYIENQLVECSEKLDYTINKTFIDLLNPVDIKTEYSKTIEIPFTPKNNILFGNIYRTDNQIQISPSTSIFQYFDPAKKLKCKLILNGKVLFSGYCKMNSITNTRKKHTYNINIFGGIGLFFSELKKLIPGEELIPEGENPDDYQKYILNYFTNTEVQKIPINRYMVSNSFSNSKPADIPQDGKLAGLYNRIGFMPVAGGFNQDFDSTNIYSYKKLLDPQKKQEVVSFEQLLVNGGTVNADTAKYLVGNGLIPRAYGEYRSYYQKPYIFMNQYFWSICKKMEEITGKKIHLDSEWFNNNNPYFKWLVKVCKNLPLGKPDDKKYNFLIDTTSMENQHNVTYFPNGWDTINYSGVNGSESILRKGKYIILPNEKITNINTSLPMQINLTRDMDLDQNPLSQGTKLNLQNHVYIEIEMQTKIYPNDAAVLPGASDKGKLLRLQKYWIIADPGSDKRRSKYKIPADVIPIWVKNSTAYDGTSATIYFNIPLNDLITFAQTSCLGGTSCFIYEQVLLAYSYRFRFLHMPGYQDDGNFAEATREGSVTNKEHYMNIRLSNKSHKPLIEISNKTNCRSYSQLSLANFLQDETIYDSFINYIKTFNLIITEREEEIYIETFKTFFKNYQIIDASEKLARDEDYKITPIIFDKKYIKFNYEDMDTQINEEYKKMTKYNYGELNIITNYNFNNETKNLFEKQFSYIPVSPSILDWNRIYDGTYRTGTPNEIMGCYYKLNDNKPEQVDYGNCYAFWNGVLKFDENFREVYITDDIDYEIINNKYMYHLNDSSEDFETGEFATKVYEYPNIDNHLDMSNSTGQIILEQIYASFAIPKYKYAVDINKSTSKPKQTDIFTHRFKKYYDEVYDLNNYKMECSLYITPSEFGMFNFNQFIIIDNVLFFVNKIIDYNPTSNNPTKCELIKVTDINAYLQQ